MTTLFEYEEQETRARVAKEAGIAKADANAPKSWKDDVLEAIDRISHMRQTFTADDVWEWIERHGAKDLDINPAALGPVMRQAVTTGLIEKTGRLVPTRLARRHRELTEWRRVIA